MLGTNCWWSKYTLLSCPGDVRFWFRSGKMCDDICTTVMMCNVRCFVFLQKETSWDIQIIGDYYDSLWMDARSSENNWKHSFKSQDLKFAEPPQSRSLSAPDVWCLFTLCGDFDSEGLSILRGRVDHEAAILSTTEDASAVIVPEVYGLYYTCV